MVIFQSPFLRKYKYNKHSRKAEIFCPCATYFISIYTVWFLLTSVLASTSYETWRMSRLFTNLNQLFCFRQKWLFIGQKNSRAAAFSFKQHNKLRRFARRRSIHSSSVLIMHDLIKKAERPAVYKKLRGWICIGIVQQPSRKLATYCILLSVRMQTRRKVAERNVHNIKTVVATIDDVERTINQIVIKVMKLNKIAPKKMPLTFPWRLVAGSSNLIIAGLSYTLIRHYENSVKTENWCELICIILPHEAKRHILKLVCCIIAYSRSIRTFLLRHRVSKFLHKLCHCWYLLQGE